jgi:hypothetical protein
MKKLFGISALIIAMAVTFSACKKDDDSSGSNSTQNLESGKSWKVSYYYDNDKEETYKFTAYTFEFKDDGTLHAGHSSGTTVGYWNAGSRFNITSFVNSPLDDLNDDWVILSRTSDVIKLKDDNVTKREELHFSLL